MIRPGLISVLLLAASPTRTYAPEAVPRVAVIPDSIALGGSGALAVQIEVPMRSGKPAARAWNGSLTPLEKQDDLWTARYRPPDARGPGWDVILAESQTGAVGAATIAWIAHTKLPIAARPGVQVKVTVAGRTYGPVTADAESVDVPIDVPPGVEDVDVDSLGPDGGTVHRKESLALPPMKRIFVAAPANGRAGKAFQATIVVIDKSGKISVATPQVDVKRGALRSLASVGPGVWKADVVPDGGPLTLVVRGEGARTRASVSVPEAAATPVAAGTVAPVASATPTPEEIAAPALPPPPSCDQLRIAPGEITTSARLKREVDAAIRVPDLLARRDQLVALLCAFPEEPSIRLQLTATWLLLGDNAAALDEVQPLLTDENELHDDHRALALSYRASAELRMGDFDSSVDDARAAESLLPGLYSATYTLGEAAFLKKDFATANAALLSAYKTAPDFAGVLDHQMLAQLLEAHGDLAEAASHAIAAARLEPNEAADWKEAARLAEGGKAWPLAYQAWQMLSASTLPGLPANTEANAGAARAVAAAPTDPQIGFLVAALDAERAKNVSKATFLLGKAIAIDPRDSVARWQLARMLHANGKDDLARPEVTRLLDECPHWAPALILAGDIERKHDPDKAAARYSEAGALPVPMSGVARGRLAELHGP